VYELNEKNHPLTRWVKKIHMYIGLLSFTILVIWGIVGLSASFLPPESQREQLKTELHHVDYDVPVDLSDRELADHAYEKLAIPLTSPAPDWSLRRDRNNNLRFRLPTSARIHDIVVLEQESRLRVQTRRVDGWSYLFRIHEVTLSGTTRNNPDPDWRIFLWAIYAEFSIWSLILMAIAGVYLWLASRPKLRWGQLSAVAGVVSFVALWVLSR
jgi:uncharacterized iron-regulated membrane protein